MKDKLTPEERLKLFHEKEAKRRRRFAIFVGIPTIAVLVLAVVSLASVLANISIDYHAENSVQNSMPSAEESLKDASVSTLDPQSTEAKSPNLTESSTPTEAESVAPAEQSSAPEEEIPVTAPDGFSVTKMAKTDIHKGILQLVNKDNEYLFLDQWPMSDMYQMAEDAGGAYACAYSDITMQEDAATAVDSMLKECYSVTGVTEANLLSGYRSKEESQDLFDEDTESSGQQHAENFIMLPGFSEHHTGLACDLGQLSSGMFLGSDPNATYEWIIENSPRFGLVLRYPENKTDITKIGYESWHFRYVGLAVSQVMTDNGLCFEEFHDFIKNYSASSPLTINSPLGTYTMYYQKGTNVPVPDGKDYWISGNNVDGFIVWYLTIN